MGRGRAAGQWHRVGAAPLWLPKNAALLLQSLSEMPGGVYKVSEFVLLASRKLNAFWLSLRVAEKEFRRLIKLHFHFHSWHTEQLRLAGFRVSVCLSAGQT